MLRRMKGTASLMGAVCVGSLLLAAGPAVAQTNSELRKLVLDQAKQIEELQRRLQQVEAKQAAPPPPAQPAPPPAAALGPTVKIPDPLPGQKEQILATSGSFPGSIRLPGTNVSFKVGGFAKADFIYDRDAINSEDLFITGSIPTQNSGREGRTRIHARESRFNLDARAPSDWGAFRALIEVDLFGTSADRPQVAVNPYEFRLRHAFGQLGPVLAGQWWSTFVDVGAYVETLDFQNSPSRIFMRQPQIRYTTKILDNVTWALAVENPEGDVFANNAAGTTLNNADRIPDFITHFRLEDTFGHLQLGALVRRITIDDEDADANAANGVQRASDNEFGWGLALSGNVKLPFIHEKDNFKFQVNYGEGYGRYVNDLGNGATILPTAFDAGVAPGTANPRPIETAEVFGIYGAVQHWWTNTIRSSAQFSYLDVDYDIPVPVTYLDKIKYASGNVIWSPIPAVDLGIEAIYGKRTDISDAEGRNLRFQMSGKYSF